MIVILFQGCYTRLSQQQRDDDKYYFTSFDSSLVGTWVNQKSRNYSGYEVSKLHFKSDGQFILEYNSDMPYSRNFYGKFGTKSDTLIIRFSASYYNEKYIYTVDKQILKLNRIFRSSLPPYWIREH